MSALHLTKVERLQIEAARRVFDPWGLKTEVGHDGRHKHLKVFGPRGGCWRLTIACTPRNDDDAVQSAVKNAKSVLRDINQRLGLA